MVYCHIGKTIEQRRLPSIYRRGVPFGIQKRKEGLTMITYQDFFLFCTFVVALISLIYQILKDKKK